MLPSLAQVLNWTYQRWLICCVRMPLLIWILMLCVNQTDRDRMCSLYLDMGYCDHDFHNFHFLGLVTVKFMQFPYTCCHGSASGWHQRTQVENDLSSCGQDLHFSRPWEKLCNLNSFSRFPCSWIKLNYYSTRMKQLELIKRSYYRWSSSSSSSLIINLQNIFIIKNNSWSSFQFQLFSHSLL